MQISLGFDNRTLTGKRRKLAQTKAPESMMILLDTDVSPTMSFLIPGSRILLRSLQLKAKVSLERCLIRLINRVA